MDIKNNRYRLSSNKIGSGSFSDVFLATDIEKNIQVAVKKISLEKIKNVIDKIENEIRIMQRMNHPNIVIYYDVVKEDDYWYIIMEYCDHGTLSDVIKFHETNNDVTFSKEMNTHYYMKQLADALNYIRKMGFIHRDIKPMNILLTTDPNSNVYILKLTDFGLARSYSEYDDSLMTTMCGSPLYMAPELIIDSKYNDRAELWSYGVVMYEMLFGTQPNTAPNLLQLRRNIILKDIDFHLSKNFTPECFDLLTKLLEKDHKNRIDWDYFVKHKWFSIWSKNSNFSDLIFVPDNEPLDKNILDDLDDQIISTSPLNIQPKNTHSKLSIPKSYLSRELIRNSIKQDMSTSSKSDIFESSTYPPNMFKKYNASLSQNKISTESIILSSNTKLTHTEPITIINKKNSNVNLKELNYYSKRKSFNDNNPLLKKSVDIYDLMSHNNPHNSHNSNNDLNKNIDTEKSAQTVVKNTHTKSFISYINPFSYFWK